MRPAAQQCTCDAAYRSTHFAHAPECPTRRALEMAFSTGWRMARDPDIPPNLEPEDMMPVWPCSVAP